MTHRLRLSAGIAQDERGITVVEFAMVAPVMLLLIMGLGDLVHQAYVQAVLDGTVQKAARDSAIQGGGGRTGQIDAIVEEAVQSVAPGAVVPPADRQTYSSFATVGPERFKDDNNNGARNPGECFDDVNGNKQWDAEPGSIGQGGAIDVTLLTYSVTYDRLFPTAAFVGWPASVTLRSQTLLRNQPYASQAAFNIIEICT